MAQYNLTDNTQPDFPFQIGELQYTFRYPTTGELRDIGKVNKELQDLIDAKADDATIEAKSKEAEDKMNALITPVDHKNPISEVLETQPLPVVRNFRHMMAKEISLE